MTPPGDVAAEAPGPMRSGRRFAPLRLLVIVMLLAVTGAAGLLLGMQQARVQTMDATLRALQDQLRQAQHEAESLKVQLTQQDADRRSLADQLSAARHQAEQAQQAITTLQQQQADAAAQSTTLQGEKEALAVQLAGAIKERDEARRQMNALRAEKDTLESRQRVMEQRYAPLTRGSQPPQAGRASVTGGAGVIELPPIVVHHAAPLQTLPPPAADVPARIVEVNERYRFVVINQGSAEGIEPGMVFDVVRNDQSIGQAVVRQVREHLTACDATSSAEAALPFRIGDTAVLQRD